METCHQRPNLIDTALVLGHHGKDQLATNSGVNSRTGSPPSVSVPKAEENDSANISGVICSQARSMFLFYINSFIF